MVQEAGRADAACIYTIGHSNQPMQHLLDLLNAHAIDVVMDVRSQPYSRYAPHFSRHSLESALVAAGFKYLFMGKELGGRPDGDAFYDAEGRVVYSQVEKADFFRDGIARLETGIQKYRVAMLCSEEDPSGCHRRLLVGRVLAQHGALLLHIRGDGRLEREDRVRDDEPDRDDGQKRRAVVHV